MKKIIIYSIKDLLKSKLIALYTIIFLALTIILMFYSGSQSKGLLSLMNISIVLCPLISVLLTVSYLNNSDDFIQLLLSLPIKRKSIFFGLFISLILSQIFAIIIGIALPMILLISSDIISSFVWLIINLIFLIIIFTSISLLVAIFSNNKLNSIGIVIFIWLFVSVIYDGIFIYLLSLFKHYPLETPALIGIMFNPIDLIRTNILLKLDISALLSYTGAVFKKFFETNFGTLISFLIMIIWTVLPLYFVNRIIKKKDF